MKTSFFSRYIFSKERKDELLSFLKIDDSLFSLLENKIKELNAIRELKDNEVRQLVKESGQTADKVLDPFNTFTYVIGLFSFEFKENLQDIIDDFKELYSDDLKDIPDFDKRFKRISELVEQYRPLHKIDLAKSQGAPYLKRSRGSVILKPVFEDRFDFDNEDIKNYSPKLIKKTLGILLELKSSSEKTFVVQFDAIEYERFLNDLIALQIELKSFEHECR